MGPRRALFALAIVVIVVVGWWLVSRARRDSRETATESAVGASSDERANAPGQAPTLADGGSRAALDPATLVARNGAAGDAGTTATGDGGDIYQHGVVVTLRVREIEAAIKKAIKQCYELAHAQHPDVRGKLKMAVTLVHDPDSGNLIASADLDKAKTTITDRNFLECATENVFGAGDVLAQLRADKDPTGGNITFNFDLTYPPPPTDDTPPWPADDASPECGPGTALAGNKPPTGDRQWCQRPDGTKDGDEYHWDDGKLNTILIYEDGTSHSFRMRPLD